MKPEYLKTEVDDTQIYVATFGAMMTRQAVGHRDRYLISADEDDMDRFAEEADAVAIMAVEALGRMKKGVTP